MGLDASLGAMFQIQINDFVGACHHYARQRPDGKAGTRTERQDAPNKPAIDALIGYRVQYTKASGVTKKDGQGKMA